MTNQIIPGQIFGIPGQSNRVSFTFNQTGHGLLIGQQVRIDAGIVVLAQANSQSNLKEGIVGNVTDPDQLDIILYGIMNWPNHGLDLNTTYFLDPVVPGGFVNIPPRNPGNFEQAAFQVLDLNTVKVLDQAVVGPW